MACGRSFCIAAAIIAKLLRSFRPTLKNSGESIPLSAAVLPKASLRMHDSLGIVEISLCLASHFDFFFAAPVTKARNVCLGMKVMERFLVIDRLSK